MGQVWRRRGLPGALLGRLGVLRGWGSQLCAPRPLELSQERCVSPGPLGWGVRRQLPEGLH